jgi:integral membrane protein (TIGR01906 family)
MAALILLIVVQRLTKTPSFYVKDRFGAGFFAGILAIALPAVFGIYAITDFNRAFVLFHKVFFPGKSNWLFDPNTDQIINILPEEFFAACGALIGVVLLILCTIMIVTGIRRNRRHLSE